jgi:hypothetical protein
MTIDAPIPGYVKISPFKPPLRQPALINLDGEAANDSTIRFKPTPYKHHNPATFPRRQFAYGQLYIRGFLSETVAPSGIGKSSLITSEIVAMTSGLNLLGIKPAKPLRVWYWNGEDPQEEIERRIEAVCLRFNVDPNLIEGRLFIDNGRETEIIVASQTRSGIVIAKPVSDALIDALKSGGFDVLIVDPFIAAHRIPENDNPGIEVVAKSFARIADATNCAIGVVHHVRKTNGNEITSEDGRGASSLKCATRSVRVLNRMTREESEKAGVKEDRRLYFRADIDKSNLAPPSDKATWFRLVSVGLGNGSGGPVDDQDYVGVVAPWQWPDAFDGVSVSDLSAVQRCVSQGRWRENCQATDWVGVAVAEALKLDPAKREHKARIKTMIAKWIETGMLAIVEGSDANRHKRTYVEVGNWASS